MQFRPRAAPKIPPWKLAAAQGRLAELRFTEKAGWFSRFQIGGRSPHHCADQGRSASASQMDEFGQVISRFRTCGGRSVFLTKIKDPNGLVHSSSVKCQRFRPRHCFKSCVAPWSRGLGLTVLAEKRRGTGPLRLQFCQGTDFLRMRLAGLSAWTPGRHRYFPQFTHGGLGWLYRNASEEIFTGPLPAKGLRTRKLGRLRHAKKFDVNGDPAQMVLRGISSEGENAEFESKTVRAALFRYGPLQSFFAVLANALPARWRHFDDDVEKPSSGPGRKNDQIQRRLHIKTNRDQNLPPRNQRSGENQGIRSAGS